MDAEDQGHRYGNFPNYYSFHPPQNRLQVLEESSILNHIRNGLLLKKRTSTTNDELFVEKAVVGSDSAAVSKAIANNDGDESVKKKARIEIEDKSHHQHENIIYSTSPKIDENADQDTEVKDMNFFDRYFNMFIDKNKKYGFPSSLNVKELYKEGEES